MSKQWKPIPEQIEADLRSNVSRRYADLIAQLPNTDFNPDFHLESTSNGYSAEVRFYRSNGTYSWSLWEYAHQKKVWCMVRDLSD